MSEEMSEVREEGDQSWKCQRQEKRATRGSSRGGNVRGERRGRPKVALEVEMSEVREEGDQS